MAQKKTDYLNLAAAFGLLPLVTGITIYLLMRFTSWFFLAVAGICVLWFGLFMVPIGLFSIVFYMFGMGDSHGHSRLQRRLRTLLVAGVLLLNFPAAWFCVTSLLDEMARYTVTVFNNSNQDIQQITIDYPHQHLELGPLLRNAQRTVDFKIEGDGNISLSAWYGSSRVDLDVEGYITNGSSRARIVILKPSGLIEIMDR